VEGVADVRAGNAAREDGHDRTQQEEQEMNKGELKDAVAEAAGLSGADAERALEAVLDTITKTVASGDKVTIPGFGTFEPRDRSARTGRNPQTGAEIQIAASTVPGFKAGAKFKAAVAK
jgi:DNA-binding protein HU-beta